MVFFVAVAGVYVFVRERYEESERESAPAAEAIPAGRELKGAP
jgi:hypothetical protein